MQQSSIVDILSFPHLKFYLLDLSKYINFNCICPGRFIPLKNERSLFVMIMMINYQMELYRFIFLMNEKYPFVKMMMIIYQMKIYHFNDLRDERRRPFAMMMMMINYLMDFSIMNLLILWKTMIQSF
jgi:hypothetical protein